MFRWLLGIVLALTLVLGGTAPQASAAAGGKGKSSTAHVKGGKKKAGKKKGGKKKGGKKHGKKSGKKPPTA